MTAKQNIPALRFPEFGGEWEGKAIGDVATKIGSGSTPMGGEKVYTTEGIIFIRSQNVNDNKLNLSNVSYIPLSVHEKMKGSEVKPNDILLNITGASIGRSCVVPSDFTKGNVNQHVCIIRPSDDYAPGFLQLFLSSEKGQKVIDSCQAGGAREGLNFQNIRGIKFNAPPLPEQQKIAYFLTAVDEKIQQLTRKKALLEQYKQGVMQQIFSREIRFRQDGGGEFGEWEEVNFGEIVNFPFTNSLSRSQLNYEYGTIKNIHYGDIHTKFKTLFDLSKENVPFVNEDTEIKGWKDDGYCQPGDLVIADASEDYKDVGKAIEIINLNDEKLVAGLHTYIARPNPDIAALGFLGFLFQTNFVRKQIMTMATGISVLGISKTNLQKLTLFLPEVNEQQKIATFLSALDEKIAQVGQQLEKAKEWKKGLLQGMFV